MRTCFTILLTSLLSVGCTHAVHINHTSDFVNTKPLGECRQVAAKTEQFVFLGFVGQTDYVDAAYSELKDKCKEGVLTGIQTRYSTSHNFLSWKNEVLMRGYCVD